MQKPHRTMTPSEQLAKELHRRRYSSQTILTYVGCLERFLRGCKKPVNKITKKDIREWIEFHSDKENTGNTMNVNLMALKFYFEQCLGRKIWVDIKYSKIPKKIQRFLTKDEVRKLLNAIPNLKHRLMVELMYSAGLRVSEVRHLQVKDLVFSEGYGFVRSGKGNKDRVFVLAKIVKEKLKNLIEMEGLLEEDFVFVTNRGSKYCIKSLQKIIKTSARNARLRNWKEIHPHTLRHSFATHLIENNYSLTDVQAVLGHKSPETSLVYTHARGKMVGITSPLDNL